jgi:pimeloyl-ACP methyl ester carboxylesterase
VRELPAVRGLLRGGRAGSPLEPPPAPAGGPPVLLVPGFLAGDDALRPLEARLRDAGFTAWQSGIGRNVDCSEATVARLVSRLEAVADRHGRRVALVGHSRGGMLARVVAQRRADLVSGLIAIGAPHRAPLALHPLLWLPTAALGAAGSVGVGGLIRLSCAVGRCCARFRGDLAAPLPEEVRCLVVYSRRDGVVDWRACLEPGARHIEASSCHTAMAGDPAIQDAVVRELARCRHAA